MLQVINYLYQLHTTPLLVLSRQTWPELKARGCYSIILFLVGHYIFDSCVRFTKQEYGIIVSFILCSQYCNYNCPFSLCQFMVTNCTYLDVVHLPL
jgi:hypothetical protein